MDPDITSVAQQPSVLQPDPVIEAYKKDIDLTLLRENLRLTVEERLNKLIALQQFAAELRRAGRTAWKGPEVIPTSLITDYLAGPRQLREAVNGMTEQQINAAPILGKWSTRQVICHIADFEPVYADRMKRIIAEHEPTMFGGDPDKFAARLAYQHREIEEELAMIESVRRHVARILVTLTPEDFQRKGIHSADGPLTLETVLQRITVHIPHHVKFIQEKRAALGIS